MWGCRQIDALAGQHVHFLEGSAEAFEMRQMGMEIECRDALEKPQPIGPALDHDRRRRAIGLGGGVEPKSIFHRHAKSGEERASETAETLLRRDHLIPMMAEFRFLQAHPLAIRKAFGIADFVMRRNDEEIARLCQKRTKGLYSASPPLACSTNRSR
jgi:hypothetical protein